MSTALKIVAFVATIALLDKEGAAQGPVGTTRVWADNVGRQVEATLVHVDARSVVLRDGRGKEYVVDFVALSDRDQRFLRRVQPELDAQRDAIVQHAGTAKPVAPTQGRAIQPRPGYSISPRLPSASPVRSGGTGSSSTNGASTTAFVEPPNKEYQVGLKGTFCLGEYPCYELQGLIVSFNSNGEAVIDCEREGKKKRLTFNVGQVNRIYLMNDVESERRKNAFVGQIVWYINLNPRTQTFEGRGRVIDPDPVFGWHTYDYGYKKHPIQFVMDTWKKRGETPLVDIGTSWTEAKWLADVARQKERQNHKDDPLMKMIYWWQDLEPEDKERAKRAAEVAGKTLKKLKELSDEGGYVPPDAKKTVFGRVIDSEGRPLSDAKVFLWIAYPLNAWGKSENLVTDKDGYFRASKMTYVERVKVTKYLISNDFEVKHMASSGLLTITLPKR